MVTKIKYSEIVEELKLINVEIDELRNKLNEAQSSVEQNRLNGLICLLMTKKMNLEFNIDYFERQFKRLDDLNCEEMNNRKQ